MKPIDNRILEQALAGRPCARVGCERSTRDAKSARCGTIYSRIRYLSMAHYCSTACTNRARLSGFRQQMHERYAIRAEVPC